MTVRERILLLRLLEKQERSKEYMEKLGLQVKLNDNTVKEEEHV